MVGPPRESALCAGDRQRRQRRRPGPGQWENPCRRCGRTKVPRISGSSYDTTVSCDPDNEGAEPVLLLRIPCHVDEVDARRQSMPVDGAANHDLAPAAGEVDVEASFNRAISGSPNRDERIGCARNVESYDSLDLAARREWPAAGRRGRAAVA